MIVALAPALDLTASPFGVPASAGQVAAPDRGRLVPAPF
jgi:hypothetical protein